MAAYYLDNLICPANATHSCQEIKKFFLHLQNCKEVKLSRIGMRNQIFQLYQKRQQQSKEESKSKQIGVDKDIRQFIEKQQLQTKKLVNQGQQFQNEIKMKQAQCDRLDLIIAANEQNKSEKLKELVLLSQNSILDKKTQELTDMIDKLNKEIYQSQDFLSKNSLNHKGESQYKEISLNDVQQEFNKIQAKQKEDEVQKIAMENQLLELEKLLTQQKCNFQQLQNQLASSIKSIQSYAQIQNQFD